MAESNKSDACECISKWAYLEFAQEKDANGKSLMEKFKFEANPHQSVANEVLILCLVFQIFKNFSIKVVTMKRDLTSQQITENSD